MTPEDLVVEVDGVKIAATVFPGDEAVPVVFLFPGGGLNRRYYDLPLEHDYSQARWLAGRGLTVVTVDHLGTGDSTVPATVEGRMVDVPRSEIERVGHLAVHALLDEIGRVGAVTIGAGHSMGGHAVVGMQAAYETFDGIASYGASMTWTRLALRPEARTPYRAAPLAEHHAIVLSADWRTNDFHDDVPTAVIAADRGSDPAWRRTTIPTFAGDLLDPFASAQAAASVRVPVLLVYGERDVTVEPLDDVAVFRAAPSVALTVVPRMGHGHNFASTRHVAWARLECFAREVAVLGALDGSA